MLPQLGFACDDLAPRLLDEGILRLPVALSSCQALDGVRQAVGTEQPVQPLIQADRQLVLAQVVARPAR